MWTLWHVLNADMLGVHQVAGNVENGRLPEHALYVGIFKLLPQKLQEFRRQLLQRANIIGNMFN